MHPFDASNERGMVRCIATDAWGRASACEMMHWMTPWLLCLEAEVVENRDRTLVSFLVPTRL